MENLKMLETLDSLELQELKKYLDGEIIQSPKVNLLANDLTFEEIKVLKSPISTMNIQTDPPVLGGRIQMGPLYIPFKPFWLHAEVKSEQYYVYTKYIYTAFTSTDKQGKNRIVVDEIKLLIQREVGLESYSKSKKNTSKFEFIDELYGVNINTGGKTKLVAKASKVSVGINFNVSIEVNIE